MTLATSSLLELAPGETASVVEVRAGEEARTRLLELGLVPGTAVRVVRYAPLGDPVEIWLRGYHLSLRRHEAELVLVQPAS